MQVIPVMDLMGGVVVRGVAGRRDEYRPLQSILCPDAAPATVAATFANLGFRQTYLADLDAIEKGDGSLFLSEGEHRDVWQPAWEVYRELMQLGLDLWIDAGLADAARARELAEFEVDGRHIAGIVAGLESLAHPAALQEICRAVGSRRIVFSLDLKAGVPLAGPAWQGLSAAQIAAIAWRAGVRRMIVLDLANVGVGGGVGTETLCRTLRCQFPELQIVAGGGVRGPGDLDVLARAGCDSALVASALHDGRLAAITFLATAHKSRPSRATPTRRGPLAR